MIALRRARRGNRCSGDRGAIALEFVIMTSAMILFIPLTVLWGRVSLAAGAVEQAAESAARTASIARTPALAQSTAQTTAADSLDQQGLECETLSVQVDTSGFTVQVGTPATVSATVTCQVRLSDLALPGLPGTHPVEGRGVSVLDTYRERS